MECPACAHENIEGVDVCENCQTPLISVDNLGTRSEPISKALRNTKITVVNSTPAMMVRDHEAIDDVISKMNEKNLSSTLVCNEEGKLVGIVTERDILFHVGANEEDNGHQPISSIMTPDPHVLSDEDCVSVAVNTLAVYGYRRVPVETNGSYSMITVQNLFEYLMKLDV